MPAPVTVCAVCQKAAAKFQPFATVRGWRYVRCPECGLVFLNPQPTDQELLDFYNGSYVNDRANYQQSVRRQSNWLELLERFSKRPGRLLEIGCSWGYFLAAARCRGWEVRGIELQRTAAHFARNELQLPVIEGTLSDAHAEISPSYDVIVAWHLLEHLRDPRKFLDEAFGLLLPGAVLSLRLPNLGSAVARLAGRYWQWLSPPEHTYMFSAQTLGCLLAACGFRTLVMRTARGNARSMWFEILRARAKSLLSPRADRGGEAGGPYTFARPPVFENRLWYRAAEGAMGFSSKPLDWLLSGWLAESDKEAELFIVAQKPIAEASTAS